MSILYCQKSTKWQLVQVYFTVVAVGACFCLLRAPLWGTSTVPEPLLKTAKTCCLYQGWQNQPGCWQEHVTQRCSFCKSQLYTRSTNAENHLVTVRPWQSFSLVRPIYIAVLRMISCISLFAFSIVFFPSLLSMTLSDPWAVFKSFYRHRLI